MMQRPIGVTILAIAMFLAIPYLLVAAIALTGGGAFLSGTPILLLSYVNMFADWPSHAVFLFFLQFPSALHTVAAVTFYCCVMIMYLTIGVGLLLLQNWSRLLVAGLAILNLTTAIIGFAGGHFLLFRQSILSIAIEVAVLVYLFRPELKEAFGTSTS
jgi:hypothetical protein